MPFAKTLPLFALLLLPLTGTAQPGPGGHRGPPPEAIEACEDLAEGDTCSFRHEDESVDGVCMPGPRPDLPLACRPEAPRDQAKRQGPPAEAIDACVDLEVDEVCWFESRGNEVEGTCTAGPRADMPMACKLARRSRR